MIFGFLGCEVVRFAIYRLEFAAVNGNNNISEHLHLPTQVNKGPTSIPDAFTVIFSGAGNGFKVRR